MRSSIEISTTTTSGCVATRRRATSIPSMPGMRTSSRTRSGESRSTASSPSSPLVGLADRLEARRRVDHVAGDAAEERLIVDRQYAHCAGGGWVSPNVIGPPGSRRA